MSSRSLSSTSAFNLNEAPTIAKSFVTSVLPYFTCKKDEDLESMECELFEQVQTIENKSFKKISYIHHEVPLTFETLRRSILNEMKNTGRASQVIDVAQGKALPDDLSQKELDIGILWFTLIKKCHLVQQVAASGANLRYYESTHGLTALHVAAFVGCTKCLQVLISKNSSLNLINKSYSPLHCAALATKTEPARILLDAGARLDSMTNGPNYETPLFIAVSVNAIECVSLFLTRGAQIYQDGKLRDMSPLFLAAELGHAQCLELILEKDASTGTKIRKTENGNTALHIAAETGHDECIEVLLENGADPNAANLRKQTPMHLAVKANSYTSVVALLKKGKADPNVEDYNKRTPLHQSVELVADSRKDIVKILISNGANVNSQDQHGFTPLHLAALNELSICVCILITNGADCSIKSNSGITAFSLIAKKTPSAFDAIKENLAANITLIYHSEALNEVEMRFDFKTGLHHPKEYSILNAFIDAGHKEMLLHPYIMAFLYVTWKRIKRCYYGMIYNSMLFSVVLMLYVLTSLANDCDRWPHLMANTTNTTNNTNIYCINHSSLNRFLINSPVTLEVLWYILLYFTLSLAYRKIYGFHGYPSLKHYCVNWGNVLEWQSILCVFIISFWYSAKVETWQVYVGAYAVICSWTNIMFLIGQLPVFGPYVEMFQKVQSEFQKLLLVFFPFLFGYTIGFCVIFPNSLAFHDPVMGFISALVMMTGDMNYNILLDYAKEESSTTYGMACAQLVFVLFLLFVTIVLMNLLVGIAVHDIQGLQKNADLSRLVRQTKMCSYIEMSHYQRGNFYKIIMTLLRVTPKPYVPVLTVRPLDPTENPNLKEIIQAAYDLAKHRESEHRQIFSRTKSEGGWSRLLNSGSLRQRGQFNMKWTSTLNQLVHKVDEQGLQIKNIQTNIEEVKELLKGVSVDSV